MTVTARQIQCAALLMQAGFTMAGASALVGNFVRESGPNLPSAFRHGKLDHGSQGLPQWRLGRLTAYMNFVKEKHPELTSEDELWPWYGRMAYQVEFVARELASSYRTLYFNLRAPGGDVAALTADVCWQYERPSKALSGIAVRLDAAKALYAELLRQHPAVPQTMDLVSALHEQAADHTNQAATGAAVGGGALVLASVGGVVKAAPHVHMAWYWWAFFLAMAVIALLAVIGAIKNFISAQNLKLTIPKVDTTAPRGGVMNPIQPSAVNPNAGAVPKPAAAPVDHTARIKAQEAAAAAADQQAIKQALAPAAPPAPSAPPVPAPQVVTEVKTAAPPIGVTGQVISGAITEGIAVNQAEAAPAAAAQGGTNA